MKSRILFLTLFTTLALAGQAAITNITELTELSSTGDSQVITGLSRNELFATFVSLTETPFSVDAYHTSRTTTIDPFNAPTLDALSLIQAAFGSTPGGISISDDGLSLYYTVDTGVTNSNDLYFSTRASTADPFPVGSPLASLNSTDSESLARLTSDELRVLFNRNIGPNVQILEATRPNTASPFSAPIHLSEISTSFSLLDISPDGLTILLMGSGNTAIYAATRVNTASPFGTPFVLHSVPSSENLQGGFVNSDLSKIYFSHGSAFDIFEFEVYSGDLDLTPPPTPTPTPTPTPSPTPFDTSTLPPINMPVTPAMIPGVDQDDVLLTGGSFDTQGRYCFFNQRRFAGSNTFVGESKLLRATPNGEGPASVEVIATQAQLDAEDSNWTATTGFNVGFSVDTLSDDSIILLSNSSTALKVWRIVPGAPPTITLLGSGPAVLEFDILAIAVDRNQSPNVIYIGLDNDIYSIPATGGSITMWKENAVNYFVEDLAVDINGDVIAIDSYLGFSRVDKDTQDITPFWVYNLIGWYAGQGLAINPSTGDLFCIYQYAAPMSLPSSERIYNVLKMERTGAETFANPTLFLYGTHILEDPDVLPWAEPDDEIDAPWGSLSFNPAGQVLWFSNGSVGSADIFTHFESITGTHGVISFWSVQPTPSDPAIWTQFE